MIGKVSSSPWISKTPSSGFYGVFFGGLGESSDSGYSRSVGEMVKVSRNSWMQ